MDTLVARIVGIVIGLLLLAAVSAGVATAYIWFRSSTVATDITTVINNSRAGFSQNANGYANYLTANEASMVSAGVFPSDMVHGGVVLDAWGNPVVLGNASGATQGTIQFGGGGTQTPESCAKAIQNMKDFVTLVVGTKTFTPQSQADSATAGDACTGNPTLTVTFQ